jgi:CRP/FNR family transcriptional regulator, cyclic AMP receptor protein
LYAGAVDWRLFAGLSDEDVRRLVAAARRRRFDRNEVVFHRGDPADALHLVSGGRFAAQITTALGSVAMLQIHGPGDAFGELALLSSDGTRAATVVALERGETRCLHRADFQRLRREHPGVNDVLAALLARRVRELSDRLVEALYTDADTRVGLRLRDLAALYGDGRGRTVIPLTQEHIAGLAGTSRATVNRVLRELERRGSVELSRGRTTVLDPDRLG